MMESDWVSTAGISDLDDAIELYRPSEVTAALLMALMQTDNQVAGQHVVEIGVGSGVVLAFLARLGAASVCGVDVMPAALRLSRAIVEAEGTGISTDFRLGDVWSKLAGRRFDLVVANPPEFPAEPANLAGRPPHWGIGGPNGRLVLDPLLRGLAYHLTPDGRAVITHNALVDLDQTRSILAEDGLGVRVLHTIMMALPQDKQAMLNHAVALREAGRNLFHIGPYSFVRMHVIEISARNPLA